MPELPLQKLDLQPRHLKMLRALLQQHLPDAGIWAYGSRVNGNSHDASDLDLVIRQPSALEQPTPEIDALHDALSESSLPIRVEMVDWARIPTSFHREIERAYVVVQFAHVHV
jgi:uncharacterized protein